MNSEKQQRIAIIGGGVAGLYCAWKLLCEREIPNLHIEIFEAASQCSGRIYTAWQYQGFPIELGATRFSKQVHPKLTKLLEHFDIKMLPYAYPDRFWFLRGKKMSLADIADGKVPYELRDEERGKYTEDLLHLAQSKSTLNDEQINTITLMDFLHGSLSAEACQFYRDAEGYDALFGKNLSGRDGIRIINQHPDMNHGIRMESEAGSNGNDVEWFWFHLANGFQELITTLKNKVIEKGATIYIRHRVMDIHIDEQSARLQVQVGEHQDARNEVYDVDRVIICVTRRDLDKISINCSPQIREAIESVETIPLVKIFATYSSSWWKVLARRDGNFCITDLPLRKIYYGPGDYLMFYNDSESADYWQDIIAQSSKNPDILMQEIQKQLSILYRVDPATLPKPLGIYSKFWQSGIHMWKPSSNPIAARNLLMGTDQDNIHICGEAFSVNTGWVEGSLEPIDELVDSVLFPSA